ncbi:MAG: hypothetical protein HFJ45_01865 [Clostridia bacterium]|nr:hypothetical protein [Clostridia bacterium]
MMNMMVVIVFAVAIVWLAGIIYKPHSENYIGKSYNVCGNGRLIVHRLMYDLIPFYDKVRFEYVVDDQFVAEIILKPCKSPKFFCSGYEIVNYKELNDRKVWVKDFAGNRNLIPVEFRAKTSFDSDWDSDGVILSSNYNFVLKGKPIIVISEDRKFRTEIYFSSY